LYIDFLIQKRKGEDKKEKGGKMKRELSPHRFPRDKKRKKEEKGKGKGTKKFLATSIAINFAFVGVHERGEGGKKKKGGAGGLQIRRNGISAQKGIVPGEEKGGRKRKEGKGERGGRGPGPDLGPAAAETGGKEEKRKRKGEKKEKKRRKRDPPFSPGAPNETKN